MTYLPTSNALPSLYQYRSLHLHTADPSLRDGIFYHTK